MTKTQLTCESTQDAFLTGSASEAEQGHLADCPTCKGVIELTRAIRTESETVPAVPGQRPQWINELHRRAARRRKQLWWSGGLGVAAAAAVAVMLIPFGAGVRPTSTAPAGDRTGSQQTPPTPGSGDAMTAPRPNPSLPGRPAWVTSDTPFTGYCTDGEPLRCVGVSLLRPSKELGRIDATDAALDALAAFAGERIHGPLFDERVRPAFENVRRGLLASLATLATKGEDIPVDDPIVRQLADARHRAAEALRADVGSILPVLSTDWYWEEYANESGAGSSYIVYIEYAINEAQLAKLIETYSAEDASRVVAAFPLLAFAFDDFEGGTLDVSALAGSTAPGALRRAITAAPKPPCDPFGSMHGCAK